MTKTELNALPFTTAQLRSLFDSQTLVAPQEWGDPCHQTLVNDALARFSRLTPAAQGMVASWSQR